MQNNILIGIGVVLFIIIAVQSYFIYDLKKEVNKNQQANNQLITSNNNNFISAKDIFANDNDLFQQIQYMQQEMDKIFNNFNSNFMSIPSFRESFSNIGVAPLSDFKDNGKEYEIKMNIPGGTDNKTIIKVDDNQLSVQADIESSKDDNNGNYFRQERYIQKFFRLFTLPSDADGSKLEKSYKNGILTIKIPKK